ncbi:T9SS type B sorting domain-containing protein [Maribacter sp. 2308TA10-17]|uniref:T9SS type B sorting domain-containing protein n=1 Tax=Maribacter sp. 2308TA10-17 TaxID=3386276 RepID=UPI0039BCA9B6
MRTLLCVMCCMLLFSLSTNAQSNNSADCRTAIPVCADGEVILPFVDGSGDIDDFGVLDDFPDRESYESGCLVKGSNSSANLENNTAWFVFRAGTGGQVGFNIKSLCTDGTENCSRPTAEWDFAVYGPDVSCGDIANRTALPIRCNVEVNSTNPIYTGVGVNPDTGLLGVPPVEDETEGNMNTYDEWLEVEPGQIYYILINNYNTNFDGDAEPFELTFTGSSVEADQDTALDCTLRDEFLGLDIIACEGDPDITLNALNSPAGDEIQGNVRWAVDYDDDGTIDDDTLTGTGLYGAEYVVTSPNSGRYFAVITTTLGTIVQDEGGILITFYSDPVLNPENFVEILDSNLSIDPDQNNIEFFVDGNSSYEYAINGGEFQDDPVFLDVPPGLNTVIVNDKNGCGTTEEDFIVVGYPKFFTPNGDGMHETWNILGIERLEDPVVFIFDRYGKLLQQLGSVGGWDGTYNGRQMPSSDYWFRFEYGEQENGAVVAKTRKTHFTLKR